MKAYERLLNYVKVPTPSNEKSGTHPSSECQRVLADQLAEEMKALGVSELLDFLKGNRSLEEAVGLAKLHTRQYAKRQRTWFRNKLKADVVLDECYWDWGQISDATEIIGMVNN